MIVVKRAQALVDIGIKSPEKEKKTVIKGVKCKGSRYKARHPLYGNYTEFRGFYPFSDRGIINSKYEERVFIV